MTTACLLATAGDAKTKSTSSLRPTTHASRIGNGSTSPRGNANPTIDRDLNPKKRKPNITPRNANQTSLTTPSQDRHKDTSQHPLPTSRLNKPTIKATEANMGYFEAVHVQSSANNIAAQLNKLLYPTSAMVHLHGDWLTITDMASETSSSIAHSVSNKLHVRTIAISGHTGVDFLELVAFSRSGEEVRRMVFTEDGWEILEGRRQRWETKLFDNAKLLDDHGENQSELVRQSIRQRRLMIGAHEPRPNHDMLVAAIGVSYSATTTTIRIGRANPTLYRGLVFLLLACFPLASWLIFRFMTTPSLAATIVLFGFFATWAYALRWVRRFATPAQGGRS